VLFSGELAPLSHFLADAFQCSGGQRSVRQTLEENQLVITKTVLVPDCLVLDVEAEELKPNQQCSLCDCAAVTRIFGIAVCSYHVAHGENDPGCPNCVPKEVSA